MGSRLTTNDRKEGLSVIYVKAVATRCGFLFGEWNKDYGVDLTIRQPALKNAKPLAYGPVLDIQVKSTANPIFEENTIAYDLKRRNYDMLVASREPPAAPMILVLVVFPRKDSRWLDVREDRLLLGACGYWTSSAGWEPSVADKRAVRVRFRRSNILDPESFAQIMRCVEDQKPLP